MGDIEYLEEVEESTQHSNFGVFETEEVDEEISDGSVVTETIADSKTGNSGSTLTGWVAVGIGVVVVIAVVATIFIVRKRRHN